MTRRVGAGWQYTKKHAHMLGVGRCNGCAQDSEKVLVITAGQVNLRLCPGCAEEARLELKR